MNQLTINNTEYAWGDVSIYLFGRPVLGVTAINYKTKKNKKALFAAGRHARAIQHGKRECDGSITLLQNEVIALNRSARAVGYEDLLDVDFDIIIKYATGDGLITIDKVVCASITEDVNDLKEGDDNMTISLPFIALRVKKNIV